MKLRDFHAMKKGLTGFVELEEGKSVTVAGMDREAKKLWCSSGKAIWTEDTAAQASVWRCKTQSA